MVPEVEPKNVSLVVVPEVEHLHHGGEHSLHDGELAAQPQGEQHHEEEDGPDGGHGQAGHCLWVGHEGQARSCDVKAKDGTINIWTNKETEQ